MTDYEKSNELTKVDYNRFSKKEFADLLSDKDRNKDAQRLIDYLCDKYHISRIKVKVTDKPRHQYGNRETYGYYRHIGLKGIDITIYNTTAKMHKEVAINTFANTLLHEFIHHYDTEYLHIDSRHTTGFYKRISDLKMKLQ